jgi:hypothetical protein
MMRLLVAFLCIFVSSLTVARGYYDGRINTYDPSTGLYYRAIEKIAEDRGLLSKTERNEAINVNIFDPATSVSTLLFKEPQPDGIAIVLFETGFKESSIDFNGGDFAPHILNNAAILKRAPKDRLLVGVRNKQKKEFILYIASKRGAGLTRLVAFPETAEWHIDVRNSKLRIIQQTGQALKIESYDW